MKAGRQPITFDRVIRILFTVGIVVAVYFLIRFIKGALLPFLIAWLLAYLLNPVVKFIQYRCRVKIRIVAILLSLLSIIGLIVLCIWLIAPSIAREIDRIQTLIHEYLLRDYSFVPFIPESWHIFLQEHIDFAKIAEEMNPEEWRVLIEKVASQIWIFLTGSVNQIINIISGFIVFIYLIFFLLDYDKIIVGFKSFIPKRYRTKTLEVIQDITVSMNRYFRGQACVAFIVGILFCIGFSIVGLPLAILLGLFIGLLNMVPYLQIAGFIPALLLCLLGATEPSHTFWGLVAGCAVVFIVVQVIQDMILVPNIMGRAMGLNPAIILFSLSVWGTLLGLIGLIIALPLTTLLLSYYERYILREEKQEEEFLQEKEKPESEEP